MVRDIAVQFGTCIRVLSVLIIQIVVVVAILFKLEGDYDSTILN